MWFSSAEVLFSNKFKQASASTELPGKEKFKINYYGIIVHKQVINITEERSPESKVRRQGKKKV